MHGIGSWGSGAPSLPAVSDGFRFLGVSLIVTLLLLASGLLSLQILEDAWFGIVLVFCALSLACLVPFLRASVLLQFESQGPGP